MKKETQRKIERAFDDAMEGIARILEPDIAPTKLKKARRIWREVPIVKKLWRQLPNMPEPTPEEVEKKLAEADVFLAAFREGTHHALRKTSKKRRGPGLAIPREKWPDVWAQIEGLKQAGKPIRVSVQLLAGQYRVNERTIFRIWSKRPKSTSREVKSHESL